MVFNGYDILYFIFFATILLPIALGVLRWRVLTRAERWVVLFLTALLMHELLAILCIALHTRNHFLYYIQTVAVLCSVAGLYDGTIGRKNRLWQLALLVSLLMVIEVFFWVGFNRINSATLSVSRLLPALYALMCLQRLFRAGATRPLSPDPMVYIHAGFFIFGAFSAITVYFKSYFIETSLDLYNLSTNLSVIMNAVAFGFFTAGFLRIRSAYRIPIRP